MKFLAWMFGKKSTKPSRLAVYVRRRYGARPEVEHERDRRPPEEIDRECRRHMAFTCTPDF